jgi:tripartite-type tricarboxylate transporter receptor subunit TctC
VTIWNGFFAPKGTPKEIIAKVDQALLATLADDKIRARLTELAVEVPTPKEASPEGLRDLLKASIDKWVPAVKAAGVKPE